MQSIFPFTIDSLTDFVLVAGIGFQAASVMLWIPELRSNDRTTRKRVTHVEKMLIELRAKCKSAHGFSFEIEEGVE